jgi:hypothetical protein
MDALTFELLWYELRTGDVERAEAAIRGAGTTVERLNTFFERLANARWN